MMTRRQYYLLKLSEECAEVAQRASKSMQFGADEIQKSVVASHKEAGLTNRQRLRNELNDLLVIIDVLEELNEVKTDTLEQYLVHSREKRLKLEKYFKYSQELGMVSK